VVGRAHVSGSVPPPRGVAMPRSGRCGSASRVALMQPMEARRSVAGPHQPRSQEVASWMAALRRRSGWPRAGPATVVQPHSLRNFSVRISPAPSRRWRLLRPSVQPLKNSSAAATFIRATSARLLSPLTTALPSAGARRGTRAQREPVAVRKTPLALVFLGSR